MIIPSYLIIINKIILLTIGVYLGLTFLLTLRYVFSNKKQRNEMDKWMKG